MKLDILTPGNWQDPYDTRIIEENHPISNIFDIIRVLKDFVKRDFACISDWFEVYIYIDNRLFGTLNKYQTLRIYAPCIFTKNQKLYYPYGKEDIELALDLCKCWENVDI